MHKMMIASLIASTFFATQAYATKIMPGNGAGDCELKETVTIGVNFNQKVASFAEARAVLDTITKQVEDLSKQQELKKLTLQSQNYNVYAQPQGYAPDGSTPIAFTYQVSGSMNYQMDNSDAAFKFAEFLTQKKMQVNVNSNAYRQGNCN